MKSTRTIDNQTSSVGSHMAPQGSFSHSSPQQFGVTVTGKHRENPQSCPIERPLNLEKIAPRPLSDNRVPCIQQQHSKDWDFVGSQFVRLRYSFPQLSLRFVTELQITSYSSVYNARVASRYCSRKMSYSRRHFKLESWKRSSLMWTWKGIGKRG